jgi:hypothetical protein
MSPQFIQLLTDASSAFRRYEAGQSLKDVVDYTAVDYAKRYPDQSWSDHIRVIFPGRTSPNPEGEDILAIYDTRALVRRGHCDVSQFRTVFGVELPGWMVEFYSHVVCALLPMLNQINILTIEESIAYESKRREELGEANMPCRLIRFADGDPTGLGFSLYQRLSDATWQIVTTPYFGTTTPQTPEEEWCEAETDSDITHWLQRMLATDGHPLIIGNESIEPMVWRRLENDEVVST